MVLPGSNAETARPITLRGTGSSLVTAQMGAGCKLVGRRLDEQILLQGIGGSDDVTGSNGVNLFVAIWL